MNFVWSLHAYEWVDCNQLLQAVQETVNKQHWIGLHNHLFNAHHQTPNRTRFHSQWLWLYGLDSVVDSVLPVRYFFPLKQLWISFNRIYFKWAQRDISHEYPKNVSRISLNMIKINSFLYKKFLKVLFQKYLKCLKYN